MTVFPFFRYQWYSDQTKKSLRGKSNASILIEKSPKYIRIPEVPQRVYNTNPKMKILVTFRDPFVRIVSDYLALSRMANRSGIVKTRNVCRSIYLSMFSLKLLYLY